MHKTYQPKAGEVKRNWHLIDASESVLGRFSTQIVKLLMGKVKASYSSHMDSGDYVVVINAKKLELSGKKEFQKVYRSHSGYPGGFQETKIAKLLKESPEKVILHSVSGMLPDNRLKSARLRRLKIFTDEKHPYGDKFRREFSS